MKYTFVILFSVILAACNEGSTRTTSKEILMPTADLIQIFKDHLPEAASSRVEVESHKDDLFDMELTTEQFERLQHAFVNTVEDHARTKYSYDRFSTRATTFQKGFSSFSISLGKGNDYHYIITGSFVLVEDTGKAVIWIKPTQG